MPREKNQSSKLPQTVPKPTIDELLASRDRADRVSADFLKVDVATALTFTGIALTANNPERKTRNRRAARRAYETVLHLMPRIQLSEGDAEDLNRNLKRLKSELRSLGENV